MQHETLMNIAPGTLLWHALDDSSDLVQQRLDDESVLVSGLHLTRGEALSEHLAHRAEVGMPGLSGREYLVVGVAIGPDKTRTGVPGMRWRPDWAATDAAGPEVKLADLLPEGAAI